MISLKNKIKQIFIDAFHVLGLDPRYAEVSPSARADLGDYQCNGAMALAKIQGMAPPLLAEKIMDQVRLHGDFEKLFEKITFAPPGFINVRLSLSGLSTFLDEWRHHPNSAYPLTENPRKIVLDFGGPNLAKEMHVGHLRSCIIGDCLQRVLGFVGHKVTSDIHFGDWGTPMGMLICQLKIDHPHLPYFDPQLSGNYPSASPITIQELSALYRQAAERCKENPQAQEEARQAAFDLQQGRPGYRALWSHFRSISIESVSRDFSHLGVHFDLWLGESHVQDALPSLEDRLKKQGTLQESQGAWIIPLELPSDKKPMPPLIMVNGDGGYSYGATDLATIEDRIQSLQAESILYVVDNRQSLHFEQVFRSARLTKIAPEDVTLEHLPFGTINGPDGKPFKTRAGGVMRLQDLISMAIQHALTILPNPAEETTLPEEELQTLARQIAISAIKYNDLRNSRTSDYVFDLQNFMTFEGRTGPYLQYAVARMNSLVRKTKEANLWAGSIILSEAHERHLGVLLCQFPEAIDRTLQKNDPSVLADYVFNLAQGFSSFYNACPILSEPSSASQQSRLQLVLLCRTVLKEGLHLLGIETPEVMVKRKIFLEE
jgi:arginyl-tRNA synthetase